ncbi:hypothetical protein [Desulfovibrio desulfuricans]|uniref:hypothetical protein n=1 Tax=Desulfovibrio desulfuricans TaxID=876 RepID=UPI001B3B2A35|nr:hypothetical protein [Desulfovibrio desulfuricans]
MLAIYNDAKQFFLEKIPSQQRIEILQSYLERPDASAKPVDMPELFERLLRSAQNANMKKGVIGKSIGNVHNLGKVLFDFDVARTLEVYSGKPEKLLSDIEKKLKPRGQVRKEPRSIWPMYCKTILSAALFLSQFRSGDEFYQWTRLFYENKQAMAALPLIISEEVVGLGYPLSCDFLKELGFIEYGKPDVHISKIFAGIGLCEEAHGPYMIQKIIVRIAEAANVSPYNVDKLFWLIGSGRLDKHINLGKNGKIGNFRQEYIDHVNAKPKLSRKRS